MRNLAALLCLTFAMLLFGAGEAWSLPKCPGSYNQNTWTNCVGTINHDGHKYVGEFKDKKQHGQGTVTYADGDKYVGELKDGKPHGQGTLTFSDGRMKKGIWENGKLKPWWKF